MPITIEDPLGLNRANVQDMPIAEDSSDIPQLSRGAVDGLSLMGSRHSQGGHTVMDQCRAVITEPMSRIWLHRDGNNQVVITAQAGATWNALHAHLAPEGLTLLVQQSSPHFTVGGSVGVNCHGRDPRQGPLSTCIESLNVFLPSSGTFQTVTPTDPLFAAVVGGYGSAAVMLSATLRVGPNLNLQQKAQALSLHDYATTLQNRQSTARHPVLHYGWLCFDPAQLFQTVLMVDCWPVNGTPIKQSAESLEQDSWASVEAMRWLWEQHQEKPNARQLTWTALNAWLTSQNQENGGIGPIKPHTDWLRQPITFTAHRSEKSVDLLQEYFVPLNELESFVQALAKLLQAHHVNVLSSTVRVVQADQNSPGTTLTHLSYAPVRAMACVALDFECPLTSHATGRREPDASVTTWVQNAINLALAHQGGYYLPYYGFATLCQFQTAYPNHAQQTACRDSKLQSLFLQTYL